MPGSQPQAPHSSNVASNTAIPPPPNPALPQKLRWSGPCLQNADDLTPTSPQPQRRSLSTSNRALDNVTVTPRSPRTDTREASTEARAAPSSRATVVFQPRHHPGAPAQDTVS